MPITLFCIDSTATGRFDKDALPDETLMELLVAGVDNIERLQRDGSFQTLEHWPGLRFDAGGCMTEIDFQSRLFLRDLEEEFRIGPGGFIDLQWIPATVVKFNVKGLDLHGSVHTATLPKFLTTLDISTNKFHGYFCQRGLPRSMTRVIISGDAFEGPVHAADMPRSMHAFWAAFNDFSGSLDVQALPRGLAELSLQGNLLSGEIDLSDIPRWMTMFDIRQNDFGQDKIVVHTSIFTQGRLYLDKRIFPAIYDTDGNDCAAKVIDYFTSR